MLELYHRALSEASDSEVRAVCISAMQGVYSRYMDVIGEFSSTVQCVTMLAVSRGDVRRQLLLLLQSLSLNYANAQLLMGTDLILQLVGLLSSAHNLETSSADYLIAAALLTRLTAATPGVRNDIVVSPMPRAKQLLSHSSQFAVLVHLLLVEDEALQLEIVRLLTILVDRNELIAPLLASSGFFEFVLQFRGSDWSPIAKLLSVVIRIPDAEGARLLRLLLPSALVQILLQDANKFAAAIRSDADTPELIWTGDFLLHLQKQLEQHTAGFKAQLRVNAAAVYEYRAVSPIRYAAIEKEVVVEAGEFAYYLRNLADEQRFGSWVITSPDLLLTSLLARLTRHDAAGPLVLRVICTLFTRYRTTESMLSFSGFPVLLDVLRGTECEDLSMLHAAEAVHRAASNSSFNAIACSSSDGISVLANVVVSKMYTATPQASAITQACLAALEPLLATQEGRLASVRASGLAATLLRCVLRPEFACSALRSIYWLAAEASAQQLLYKAGCVLFLLVPPLRTATIRDASSAEAAVSSLAALARLCGIKDGKRVDPEHLLTVGAVNTLLSQGLAERLRTSGSAEFLREFCADHLTPRLMWNDTTRTELMDFVDAQISQLRGEFPDQLAFVYRSLSSELRVGGVFVRLFNAQPVIAQLESPRAFAESLLQTLGTRPAAVDSLQLLTALHHVVASQSALLEVIAPTLVSVFDVLRSTQSAAVRLKVLHILTVACTSPTFINAMANTAGAVAAVTSSLQVAQLMSCALQVLLQSLSNSALVNELLRCGGLLHVMSIFAGFSVRDDRIRVLASMLLRAVMLDTTHGNKAVNVMLLYLPKFVLAQVRSDCLASIQFFDSFQESAELIWSEPIRAELRDAIAQDIAVIQQTGEWHPPAKQLAFGQLQSELVVANVYLRLFNEDPTWPILGYQAFNDELVQKLVVADSAQTAIPLLSALVGIFQQIPTLVDSTAKSVSSAFIARVVGFCGTGHPKCVQIALRLLYLLCISTDFSAKLFNREILSSFLEILPQLSDHLQAALGVLLRAVRKGGEPARAAISGGLVDALLQLLSSPRPGAVKAAAAHTLQVLARADQSVFVRLDSDTSFAEFKLIPLPEDEGPIQAKPRRPNPYVTKQVAPPVIPAAVSPSESATNALFQSADVVVAPVQQYTPPARTNASSAFTSAPAIPVFSPQAPAIVRAASVSVPHQIPAVPPPDSGEPTTPVVASVPAVRRGGPAPPPPPPAEELAVAVAVPAVRRGGGPPPPGPPPPIDTSVLPAPAASSERNALLAAIRQGNKLKKVDPKQAKPKPMPAKGGSMADALSAAISSRRGAMKTDDDDPATASNPMMAALAAKLKQRSAPKPAEDDEWK
eukprot:TRINITY_DN7841_c0_g1_i1.p1 TRINITY_DN7841_c0_g1~~TRINITY_DN7841_c0_g1_i1.p1  ORF type:complete len:1355 (-),score=283.10 TRINITY_DN7841_c0_g1_i1:33-4097(-)